MAARSSPDGSVQADAPARRGGRVVEGWAEDVKTFNPVLCQDVFSNLVAGLCFEPLLTSTGTGELVPALAEEVPAVSGDGLTYRFTLRPNATWSDGRPLTSDDVVFTYRLMWAPEFAEVASPRRGELSTHLAAIEAPDRRTVVFRTKTPYAPFLVAHCQCGILPAHVLSHLPPSAIGDAQFNSGPDVVSGVFRFVRWDPGREIVLDRNERYVHGPSLLDGFSYRVLPDSLETARRLRRGELDVAVIDPSQLDDFRTAENIEIIDFDIPTFTFYAYQLDPARPASRLFAASEVRQALLHGLDRRSMAERCFGGSAIAADSVMAPSSWAHDPAAGQTCPYDPERANELLERAGWRRGADGIRARDGRRLRFEIVTGSNARPWVDTAEEMRRQWSELGAEVRTCLLEFPALISRITEARDFDVFLVSFNWSQDPDQSVLFSSRAIAGGFNCFSFRDAEIDDLLADAVTTFDRDRRRRLYGRYQRRMAELVPAPILFYNRGVYGVNRRVRGYRLGPFSRFETRPWMKDVWVDAG